MADLNMSVEVKEEVIEASATSLPATLGAESRLDDSDGDGDFQSALDSDAHYSLIPHLNVFKCELCQYVDTEHCSIKRHMKTIHLMPSHFSCGLCARVFRDKRSLLAHRSTHLKRAKTQLSKKGYFYCVPCGQQLRSTKAMWSHETTHARNKDYLCSECPQRFSFEASLLRHVKAEHARYQCERCGRGFVVQWFYDKHREICDEGGVSERTESAGRDGAEPEAASLVDSAHQGPAESVSEDALSAESAAGTETCRVSAPPREDCARETAGAEKVFIVSGFVDPESEETFSADVKDKESDDSECEDAFPGYAALDEQPSTDPLSLD